MKTLFLILLVCAVSVGSVFMISYKMGHRAGYKDAVDVQQTHKQKKIWDLTDAERKAYKRVGSYLYQTVYKMIPDDAPQGTVDMIHKEYWGVSDDLNYLVFGTDAVD